MTPEHVLKILALTGKINSTLNLDELLGIIMNTACEVMESETASLLLVDEKTQDLVFRVALGDKGAELAEKFRVKMGEGIAGHVAQTGEAVIIHDAQNDPRLAKRFDQSTGFITRALLCVPLLAKGKIIGVLQAINPCKGRVYTNEDLEFFKVFADQAAIAVENARLHGRILEQEKAKRELEIAREIQQHFLPDLEKTSWPFQLAVRNFPARDVSGDFYDIIRINDDETGLLIADVSGKGVPAALLMVNAMSHFRFLALKYAASPSELLDHLNRALTASTTRGMFITLLYFKIHAGERKLSFASAGHAPALCRTGKDGKSFELACDNGLPLGLMEESVYPENVISFERHDTFFLYTDGVTEGKDKGGAPYGIERLLHQTQTPFKTAREEMDHVLKNWKSFTQGAEQHDDTTLMVLKML